MKNLIFITLITLPFFSFAGNESGGLGSPVVSAMNAQLLYSIQTVKYVSESSEGVFINIGREENSVLLKDAELETSPDLAEAIKKSYLSGEWISVK